MPVVEIQYYMSHYFQYKGEPLQFNAKWSGAAVLYFRSTVEVIL